MIYLDNAATTFPKPECVYEAVDKVGRTLAVNVGRGSYRAAKEAMKIVDDTRRLLARFVRTSEENVVFAPSATLAANEIILGLEWNPYRNVYLTPFEHNAIVRPLHTALKKHGITPRMIKFDPGTHELDRDDLRRRFASAPPDYVFLNQVSNVTGTIIPVKEIARLCKEYGAKVIVDGSQSLGLVNVDLSDKLIDLMIFAGHKNLCSPFGIGGFISGSGFFPSPSLSGGNGSDSLNPEMPEKAPAAFEFASPDIVAIAGLKASLEWLGKLGVDAIRLHKDKLLRRLTDSLSEKNVRLYLPKDPELHTGVLSFNIPGYDADEVGTILSEDFDIAVRTGYHCAPFIHDLIGTKETHGTVRVSPGYFNNENDIDVLIDAVSEILEDLA